MTIPPAAGTPTTCYGLVEHVARSVRVLGFDRDLDHARFPGSDPSYDAPVPAQQLFDLWDEVRARSGEVGWGLRLAELDRARDLGVVGPVVRNARTLGEALVQHSRLLRLWTTSVRSVLTVSGSHAFYELQCPYPDLVHPESVEHLLADWIWLLDLPAHADGHRAAVHLRHRRPDDLSHHERVLGLRVVFDADRDGVLLDAAALVAPVPGADPTVLADARRRADEELDAHVPHETLVSRVEAVIAEELANGAPRIDVVAERLGVHPKTLNRRLVSHGGTYHDVLEGVRRRLAYRYLATPLNLEQVAYRLGYSEAAAFTRAFRRWTGTSPGSYRESGRDRPPAGGRTRR